MMSMLNYMADNQAEGEDAAYEFLSTYPEVWTQWVTPQGAAPIKKAL